MTFAAPSWLGWLATVPLLVLVMVAGGWRHRYVLRRMFADAMLSRIVPPSVRRRRFARDLGAALAVVLAIVALAEPRFDKVVRTVTTRGTDIVVLLDLSRSMDAQDVDPSRLERARREIADLGKLSVGDRIGLVLFAGGAYPRLPLTEDFRALDLIVNEAETDLFESQGSDLGAAIQVGIDLLDRSRQEAGQAMLVLSDGEIHDAESALAAADAAAARKVPIYVVGIGLDPAPIPTRDGRFLTVRGETVTTTPDFEILKDVAKRTGGAFVTSSPGSRDLEELYGELRRAVSTSERTSQRRETWRSAFQVPLGIATVLLLGGAWLGDGRRRFGAAAAVLGALALAAAATPARADDPLAAADQAYRSGDYRTAIERLVELSLEHPDDADVADRLGAARYRSGDYDGAARAFDSAARLRGGTDADAWYNAGNAYWKAGRLVDAFERFGEAIEQAPDHTQATHNREVLEKELAARRAMTPPPPPQPQPKSEGDQNNPEDAGSDPENEKPQPKPGDQQGSGDPQQPQDGEEGSEQDMDAPTDGGEQQNPGAPKSGKAPSGTPSSGDDANPGDDASSDAFDPRQLDPQPSETDPNGQPTGGGDASGEDSGPITAGQAHRLLDAIEEGGQRVTVQGKRDQKPW